MQHEDAHAKRDNIHEEVAELIIELGLDFDGGYGPEMDGEYVCTHNETEPLKV